MTAIAKIPEIKYQSNLKNIIKAEKDVDDLFYNERMRQIGMHQHLKEVYKPLLEQQERTISKIEEGNKQAKEIAEAEMKEKQARREEKLKLEEEKHIEKSEILEKIRTQPKIGEILTLLQNYPEVIKWIRDLEYNLTPRDSKIIDLINKLPDDQQEIIREYFVKEEKPKREIVNQSDLYTQFINTKGNDDMITSLIAGMTKDSLEKLKEEIAERNVKTCINQRYGKKLTRKYPILL